MESTIERLLLNRLNGNLKVLMTVQSYQIGLYSFDVEKRLLKLNAETVKLTRKESYLLVYLVGNNYKLLLRNEILTAVWKEDTNPNLKSLEVYICKLRKLLSKDPNIIILNIHNKGYKMIVP